MRSLFSFLFVDFVIQFLILYEDWSGALETTAKTIFYVILSFVCGTFTGYLFLEYIRLRTIENLLKAFEDVF